MSKYTTGELAKLCGVSVRTVQYYDNREILMPSELSEGGRRLYSEKDLETMQTICFLKDLGLSLNTIAELIKSDNSKEVIKLIFEEQEKMLKDEIEARQLSLQKIETLRKILENNEKISVKSIKNVAKIMQQKKEIKKLHLTLLLSAIPIEIIEWASIVLWIKTGIWWVFAIYTILCIPYAVFISKYYFKRVAYICPQCHETFKPKLKEAFWANHTPRTRKLTCPCCKRKGFCIEIYQKERD